MLKGIPDGKQHSRSDNLAIVHTPEFLLRAFLPRNSVQPRFVWHQVHREGISRLSWRLMLRAMCAQAPYIRICGSTPGHTAGSRMCPDEWATLKEIGIKTASFPRSTSSTFLLQKQRWLLHVLHFIVVLSNGGGKPPALPSNCRNHCQTLLARCSLEHAGALLGCTSAAANHAERPTQAVESQSVKTNVATVAWDRSSPASAVRDRSSKLILCTCCQSGFDAGQRVGRAVAGRHGLWLSSGHPTSAVLPLGWAGRTAPCSGQWHGA